MICTYIICSNKLHKHVKKPEIKASFGYKKN